jgi:hypothetical protein
MKLLLPIVAVLVLQGSHPIRLWADRDVTPAMETSPRLRPGGEEPEMVDGILRITLQGIASEAFFVKLSGDTLYLPFVRLCDFLRIPVMPGSIFSDIDGELPAGTPFHLSSAAKLARYGADSIPITPTALRLDSGELYVEGSFLRRWLQIPMQYDTSGLRIVIGADERIPRVLQARNRKKYALLSSQDDSTSILPPCSIERQMLGYPTIDWAMTAARSGSGSQMWGSLQLGAPLLYGVLDLNAATRYSRLDSSVPWFGINGWSWQFLLPTFDPLRKIVVGSNQIGNRSQYELEVSNIPLTTRPIYGTGELEGYTQPGWMVEIYEGSRLVDVTKADSAGRYRFDMAVGYGTTDRTIVQVGPHGERFAEERRIELAPQLVPVGQIDYQLRASALDDGMGTPFEGSAYTGMGITDRLTLGLEALVRSARIGGMSVDSVIPAASASIWIGEAGFLGLRYNPRWNLFKAEYSWLAADNSTLRLRVDSLSPVTGSFISSGSATIQWGPLTWGATARYARTAGTEVIGVLPRVSGYLEGVSFTLSTDLRWSAHSAELTGYSYLPYRMSQLTSLQLISAVVPRMLLSARGTFDHDAGQLSALGLSASYYLSRTLGLGLSWQVDGGRWRTPALGVQVRIDLNRAAGITLAGSYRQEELTTSSYMHGSAIFSPDGPHFHQSPSIGGSTVVVRSFKDDNGNGVRDADEEDLGERPARLSVATSQLASKEGMFLSIPPNNDCIVEVDRWSLADRGLFPRRTFYPVYSIPNSVHVVDIPFAAGFDVSGRCEMAAGHGGAIPSSSLIGMSVQLVAVDGSGSYEGEVFHDGSIAIVGVAAGTYRVEIDRRRLASRRLRMVPMTGTVTLDPANNRLPAIILEPVTSTAPDAERGS